MTKLIRGSGINVEMSHASTMFFYSPNFYSLEQFSERTTSTKLSLARLRGGDLCL